MNDKIVGELYRTDPDRFVAERDRHVADAREAGDKETAERLRRLRRPALAAWALNNLRHADPDRVNQLFDLGEQVRAAQRALRGDDLRGLGRQRDDLLDALTRRAASLAEQAGHPLSATTTEQVRQTLTAALSDPEAAQRLSEATLTKPVEYSGFGMNEVADWAVAEPPAPKARPSTPSTPSAPKPASDSPAGAPSVAQRRRWEAEYDDARQQRDVATERLDRARAELADREREQQETEQQRTRLREELARVDQAARETEKALKVANNRFREAVRSSELADRRVAEVMRRAPE